MIQFLDILSTLIAWGYGFVFFWIIKIFLPLRKNWFMKIGAFLVCEYVADFIIYSNDLYCLIGILILFSGYLLIFHRGKLIEKLSVLLMFCPALIAINYLMLDIGSRMFFAMKDSSYDEIRQSSDLLLLSTGVHTISLLLRLLFWIGAWLLLRRVFSRTKMHLNLRMWLMVDMLMLASFVAIFTIIYFMPRDTAIVYPICGASVFSGFGCMYLVSYICNAMETAYHAQELERQRNYYKDRMNDEERVRSIYHDFKNHLLVLQAETGNSQKTLRSIELLQGQIAGFENYLHTGNEFLDIILRDKTKAAQEKSIDFSAVISFEDGSFMEPLDISTIFGNALDNAIEASERLPQDQRQITVKAGRVRNMLIIRVMNNILPDVSVSRKTTKADSFLHGFGLSNIQKAAEQYDGHCSTSTEHGVFTLKVILPVPDANAV